MAATVDGGVQVSLQSPAFLGCTQEQSCWAYVNLHFALRNCPFYTILPSWPQQVKAAYD